MRHDREEISDVLSVLTEQYSELLIALGRGGMMTYLAWIIFVGAAILEVGGDAVVRKGLRGSGLIIILIGCTMLGSYGVVVNMVKWDFSKLLGVYVAIFAAISVLFGRFMFHENVPGTTWIGLLVIVCGAMIIQFGNRIWSLIV